MRRGEVFGLLGPNGAGKTTVIRVLTGLLKPVSGGARVFGVDVARDTMRVRQTTGHVPQQLSVDAGLSGWENVWLFARLLDVPRRERDDRIEEALDVVGLLEASRRLAGTYSGGMIRRLELAQALVNRPQLLILDEPTIGLDPLARASVWERVEALRHELGMTVLLTTHYMEEADELCHRIAVMHRGTVRADGTPQALKVHVAGAATLGAVFIVVISAGFFSCLSMTIAGLVLSRERLMGIGQAITMPLFFGSSALYPVSLMPGWLRAISVINPLSYEVDALRGLLVGTPRTGCSTSACCCSRSSPA